MKQRLTTAQAADYLGVAPSTVAKWRDEGRGPAYTKTGGLYRYALADLDLWLAQHRVDPEAQAKGGGK